MKIEISTPYGFSFIGRKPNNEDNVYPSPEKGSVKDSLFLVCDGVGGRDKGEVASAVLCESLSQSISGDFAEPFFPSDFKSALAEVYHRLNELEDPHVVRKMGSTLTFLKFHSRGAMVAHIGDSRVYHIRPTADQPILFRTEDHSLVATLVKAGMITKEEAAVHPKRNVIHRAVQPHDNEPAEADIYETDDLQPGDYFFLCSDGILENLTDQLLVSVLQNTGSDKNKIDEIKHICEGKTNDNYSAWLVCLKSVSGDGSSELAKEVLVLREVQQNPVTTKGKFKNKTAYIRTSKWSFVLLFSLLLLLVILFFSYQKINSKKPVNQFDSAKIKEEKRINPTPDSLNTEKANVKANGKQKDTLSVLKSKELENK